MTGAMIAEIHASCCASVAILEDIVIIIVPIVKFTVNAKTDDHLFWFSS